MKQLFINEIVNTISETSRFDVDELYAVNTSDILDGEFLNPPLLPVGELKGQFKKTIQKNDILFSEIRPANRRFAKVPFDDCSKFVCSTKLMVLRKFNRDVDLDYFYYALTNQHFLNILQRRAENRIGSFPQITFELLSEYKFSIPSLEQQKKIVSILSALDNKIAMNKKMNQKLETMAKRLYDYWFVQFDFPDKNGRPYKTSGGPMTYNPTLKREIPVGWDVKCIEDVCRILTGKEDANFASGNGKFKFFTCSSEPSLCDKAAFEGHAVLIAGNGDFNVKHYSGKFNAYQRTYVLIPPDKYYAMLYIAALERIDSFKSGSNGSIVKFITKGDVENICVFDGAPAILYSVINNLIFQYEKISLEIEKLSLFRNKLLPLLMNGQVTVA